ncbi:MAG: radical SAM protein [Acidobacteriota bacterium]
MRIGFIIPPSKHAKNVARDLVYGCWCKGRRIAGITFPPISQLEVATWLRQNGHDVRLLDAPGFGWDMERLVSEAKDLDASVTLTSTMTINDDAECLAAVKAANPKLKTTVYGAHPTFMPEQTVQKPGIDFAVRREPEMILKDLFAALQDGNGAYKEVAGIAFRDGAEVKVNPYAAFIKNLDILPIPDRKMLPSGVDYFNPIVKRQPYTTMFTSRGCPAQCTYCSSPPFYGDTVRFRSAAAMLEELEQVAKMGYREVFFRDEIFTASRRRVMDLCDGILSKGLKISWICSSRVSTIDREMMVQMKKAGCHLIRFGVESSNQEILDLIKKGTTVEQAEKTFANLHEVGLDSHAHMMIGMPGETEGTIRHTINWLKYTIKPTVITFGICTPYPGTELFDMVKRLHPAIGDGSESDMKKLHTTGYYNELFQSVPNDRLEAWIRRAYSEFYMRPSYLLGWVPRLRSLDELFRVSMAGTQVLGFVWGQD